MADIVERLRSWVHAVDAVSASDLMDEAAGDIERLNREVSALVAECQRQKDLLVNGRFPDPESNSKHEIGALADEEREAVAAATANYQRLCDEYGPSEEDEEILATLRGLLGRLG